MPKKLNQRSLSRDELGLNGIQKKKKKKVNISEDLTTPRGTVNVKGRSKSKAVTPVKPLKKPQNVYY